jgi:uncharacterized protein (DUF697 family)
MKKPGLLQRIQNGTFDQASAEDRARTVRDLVQACSLAAAAATVQPVPFLDLALITPIQIGMVQGIGRLRGYSLDMKSVFEMLRTLRVSMLTQSAILTAADLVPVLGSFVQISVAYAFTYALGEVTDYYFRTGRRTPADELRAMFKRIYKEKRRGARYRDLKPKGAELERLKLSRKKGALTEAEFEAKKEQVLERP